MLTKLKNNFFDAYAKFEFWYAKNYIKVDKHYTFFVDLNSEPGSFAIKYLKKYKGVIVEFNKVNFDDSNMLNFDYDIIANPNNYNVKTKKFDRFTCSVMRNIILSAIDNAVKETNETRNTNSVKSNSKRAIHEEVSAVSKKRVSNRKPRKKAVRGNKTVHPKVQ